MIIMDDEVDGSWWMIMMDDNDGMLMIMDDVDGDGRG